VVSTKDSRKIFSVGELTKSVKQILEKSFPLVWVNGEISNLNQHSSGHWYFSLKDRDAQIRIVMFRGANRAVKFAVENGLEIIVGGRLTIYEKSGQYQIVADILEPKGLGALQLAFEQLKEKLEKQGLFSEERKRAIPFFPKRVGIVTSPTGAVIQDVIHVTQRRYPGLPLLLCPVRVQGEGASKEICEGIQMMNQLGGIDVLIVGRGGGSLEDLWSFNEENVARAIFESRIPIISAVGHETDWTIADFVADHRAPTPSAAAETVAPVRDELLKRVWELGGRIRGGVFEVLKDKRQELTNLMESYAFRQPQNVIEQYTQRVDELLRQIVNYSNSLLHKKSIAFQGALKHLEALSPLGVLARGYSLTFDSKGRMISSASNVKKGDTLRSKLSEGTIYSQVTGVDKNE